MRERSIPRWMRGVAAVTTAAFGWTFLVATPVQVWAQGKRAFNPLRRVLSDAEMKTIVGGTGTVPQTSNGTVTFTGSDSPAGTELWDIVRLSDSTIVGKTSAANGWSCATPMGGSTTVSAPGSAGLGSYRVRTYSGSGDFDVVQPATSLRSGSAYPWEGSNSDDAIDYMPDTGVNFINGNKQTVIPIVGWTARGGLPVSFALVHNSQSNNNLMLGQKWTHSYDLYLVVDSSGNVTTHWGDDLSYVFTKNVNGSYSAPAGIYDSLVKNTGGTYTLTTKHKLVYEFDLSLRCTSITDRNGNSLTLTYASNNLQSVTDPTGRTLSFDYSHSGLNRITDPLGRSWTLTYSSGKLSKVNYPLLTGQTTRSYTQFGYDSNNNITTLTTPRGKAWTFSYFSDSSLQWEKDPLFNQTSYQYTTTAKTITDPNGNVTTLTYNSNGELTQVKDPLNKHNDFTYDSSHNTLTVVNKRGYTNTLTYDSSGNVLTLTNPYSKVWTYTYTSKNDVDTVTDPLSHVTDFDYDTAGNLTKVTNANSHVTDFVVNSYGLTTDIKTYPVSGTTLTTTYGYDSNGHCTSVTDPLSHATTYTVDGIGRVTAVTDALSHSTTTSYDNWSRVSSQTSPAGTTSYVYDVDSH